MAEKIMIEVFKKKTMEELSQALADPDGKLETGSGAAAAGLQAGDVITHLNDVKVTDFSEACTQRDKFRAGEDIAVTYCRKKVSRTVLVHLMDRRDVSSDYNF